MNIIICGCLVLIFNLLVKDIKITNLKAQVVGIVKYFQNNHFASAELQKISANKLELPIRWNSVAGTMESYLSNWLLILKVCEDNCEKINLEFFLKRETYKEILKIIY